MDYSNRLKGTIAQTLLRTLLEGAGYRVVPFGIEAVIRELQILTQKQYMALKLAPTLRSMPDFLITNRELNNVWFVEVKYRSRWDKKTQNDLANKLKRQVETWGQIHLMIFLGEAAKNDPNSPSSWMKLAPLNIDKNQLVSESQTQAGQPIPWKDLSWEEFHLIQSVFTEIKAPEHVQQQTIRQTFQVLAPLGKLGKNQSAASARASI